MISTSKLSIICQKKVIENHNKISITGELKNPNFGSIWLKQKRKFVFSITLLRQNRCIFYLECDVWNIVNIVNYRRQTAVRLLTSLFSIYIHIIWVVAVEKLKSERDKRVCFPSIAVEICFDLLTPAIVFSRNDSYSDIINSNFVVYFVCVETFIVYIIC